VLALPMARGHAVESWGEMQVLSRVLNGEQYVANFLDQPVSIGTVFRVDDGQAIIASHISDFDEGVNLRKYISSGAKGTLKFSESKDMSVRFGRSATTELGDSEVSLKFRRARPAAGALGDVFVDSLRFDPLLEVLQTRVLPRLRDGHGRLGHADLLRAEEQRGGPQAQARKQGDKDRRPGIRNVAHTPLFKAFRFKGNREPEVLG
jgi:hypothetical protein